MVSLLCVQVLACNRQICVSSLSPRRSLYNNYTVFVMRNQICLLRNTCGPLDSKRLIGFSAYLWNKKAQKNVLCASCQNEGSTLTKAELIEKTGCPLLIFANLRAIMRAEKARIRCAPGRKEVRNFVGFFRAGADQQRAAGRHSGIPENLSHTTGAAQPRSQIAVSLLRKRSLGSLCCRPFVRRKSAACRQQGYG